MLGSREGKIVVWTKNEEKLPTTVLGKYEVVNEPIDFKNESVTAVTFAPEFVSDKYLIAIGLDSGFILLYYWCQGGWNQVLSLSQRYSKFVFSILSL